MLTFVEFRQKIKPKEICNRAEAKHHYRNYIMNYKIPTIATSICTISPCVSFSDCKPAATPKPPGWAHMHSYNEEQESNLMAYDTKNTTTAAVASIINAASDESKQREFLLGELKRFAPYDWRAADAISDTLRKMFNIDAPKAPRGSQELLDAFKAGAFTVDQAKVNLNTKYTSGQWDDSSYDEDDNYIGERYYGITFTTLLIEDTKGYEQALAEFQAARTDTIRTIMIGTPTEGLAALKALESWKTTVIPATTPVAPVPVAA